jgi:hypothetical protein
MRQSDFTPGCRQRAKDRWFEFGGHRSPSNGEGRFTLQDILCCLTRFIRATKPPKCRRKDGTREAKSGVGFNRSSAGIDGIAVFARVEVRDRLCEMRAKIQRVEWTQLKRPLCAFNGTVALAHPRERNGAPGERKDVRIAKLKRPVKKLECGPAVMLSKRDDKSGRSERHGIISAMQYRGMCMLDRGCAIILVQTSTSEAGV